MPYVAGLFPQKSHYFQGSIAENDRARGGETHRAKAAARHQE